MVTAGVNDFTGVNYELQNPEQIRQLALDAAIGDAKAEAISVLSQQGNIIDVLVMFDGLESGGPRQYRILIE